MVETAKSARIFTSAFTWFLWRTVPTSRKAKPECIAKTRIAPMRMKNTSAPAPETAPADSIGSMKVSPFLATTHPPGFSFALSGCSRRALYLPGEPRPDYSAKCTINMHATRLHFVEGREIKDLAEETESSGRDRQVFCLAIDPYPEANGLIVMQNVRAPASAAMYRHARLHKKEPAEGICGLKPCRERPEEAARGSQPWERSGP